MTFTPWNKGKCVGQKTKFTKKQKQNLLKTKQISRKKKAVIIVILSSKSRTFPAIDYNEAT